MATADTRALRPSVRERAQGRCEYCLLPEEADFTHHEVDHIVAEQHGGKTALENLAYACFDCNKYKGPNIGSIDPDTGERTWLFNPRTQQWDEHFLLEKDGVVIGLTAEGRATARLLHINDPERVQDRLALLAIGKLHVTQRQ
jgi:hypothetical protein